jgi:hypothetical protein
LAKKKFYSSESKPPIPRVIPKYNQSLYSAGINSSKASYFKDMIMIKEEE